MGGNGGGFGTTTVPSNKDWTIDGVFWLGSSFGVDVGKGGNNGNSGTGGGRRNGGSGGKAYSNIATSSSLVYYLSLIHI